MRETQKGDYMEAVLVVDMGTEELSNEGAVVNWFNTHNCKVEDDIIYVHYEAHEEVVEYTYFDAASTCMFKFETDGDYFPLVLTHFIENLKDLSGTQISVAEQGNYGAYENLVDMTLKQFINHVIKGEDV